VGSCAAYPEDILWISDRQLAIRLLQVLLAMTLDELFAPDPMRGWTQDRVVSALSRSVMRARAVCKQRWFFFSRWA
jgi:hypothetical protein